MIYVLAVFSCTGPSDPPPPAAAEAPLAAEVIDALSMTRIRDDVDLFADDARGGRVPGSPGHLFVADTLALELAAAGLEPVGDSFQVRHPLSLDRQRWGLDEQGNVYETPMNLDGVNLLGVRWGTERPEEVVLLVAHYDHLGVTEQGEVYNGAFDDITAVCALLELARVLESEDVQLPRSVAFLFTDAEEDGLDGAYAWVADPTLPLPDLVAALSVDPIGRPILTDFMPLIALGAERSPELARAIDAIAPFVETPITQANRKPVIGFASDQDAFWDAPSPVPSLWIASAGMTFYHTVDDDPQTIDYRSVKTHLESIAQLTAHLARSTERPTDIGEQDLSVHDIAQAAALVTGALESSELTEAERATAQGFKELFDAGVASGEVSTPQYFTGYVEMLLYVIQELTPAHPGPIPPPFPE